MLYLKSRSVVHNDIKAANILISVDRQAKFIDFGCSFLTSQNPDLEGSTTGLVRNENSDPFNGTIPWMAPEALIGDNQTPYKSEIWSFGCMLLEVITGKRPWHHIECENIFQLMIEISMSDEVPEVPEGKCDPDLAEFIQKCLVRDPAQRPSAE